MKWTPLVISDCPMFDGVSAASQDQRLLTVMYVDRDEVIRIISARRVTRQEQRNHEETS